MECIELERPHGFLMWRGKKTAVLTPDELPEGEPLEVHTGDEAFGVVILGHPALMMDTEADRKEYFERHRVKKDEREKRWPDATAFRVYPAEFEPYQEIKKVSEFHDYTYNGVTVKATRRRPSSRDDKKYMRTILVDGKERVVHYGDPNLPMRRDEPERRENFLARHNCSEKKDPTKPGYWACRDWSRTDEKEAEPQEEDNMPYEIEMRDGEHCVVKKTGEVVKCHPTHDEAVAHLAALKINVEEAEKEIATEDDKGLAKQMELKDEEILRLQARVKELERGPEETHQSSSSGLEELDLDIAADLEKAKFDESEWDGAASNWSDTAAYCQDCLLDFNTAGEDKVQRLCMLPYRYPGKPPNKNALRAIAGGARGINAVKKPEGVDQDMFSSQVSGAKRKLRGWWPDAFDKEAPESLKARGEGQGVGGERQGDEGAEMCVCPKCGTEYEHEKGVPCSETPCPKCDEVMEGKAGRRVKKPMADRLREAWQTIKDVLTWADYEDEMEEPNPFMDIFKDKDNGFVAVKGVNGEPMMLTWTTNAFIDRDGEIFSTKGLERYVEEAAKSGERGTYNLWHVPGTDFAKVTGQLVNGRYLIEWGPFLDDEKGQAAQKFFMEFPERHPVHAPEGWGMSPEFRYLPEERKTGVFETFWIVRRSVLPRMAAANTRTRGGSIMATKEQEALMKDALGEEITRQALEGTDQETKKNEEAGVAHKEAEQEVPQTEPPEEGTKEPEIDLNALAEVLTKNFSVEIQPLIERSDAVEARLEKVEAWLAEADKSEAARKEVGTPRFVLSLEKRASQAQETIIEADDELLQKGPKTTATGKTQSDQFLDSLKPK